MDTSRNFGARGIPQIARTLASLVLEAVQSAMAGLRGVMLPRIEIG